MFQLEGSKYIVQFSDFDDDDDVILEGVDHYEFGFDQQSIVNFKNYVKSALDYMVSMTINSKCR